MAGAAAMTSAAAMAAFVAMEQAAAATLAAAAAVAGGRAAATVAPALKQTTAAAVATVRTTATAANGHRTGATAATVTRRTMAEVRGLGAAAQSHHQHNAVHMKSSSRKREANPRTIKKPQGLEPFPLPWPQQRTIRQTAQGFLTCMLQVSLLSVDDSKDS